MTQNPSDKFQFKNYKNSNLPTTTTAKAVVPEARPASNEPASVKAVSGCRNADAMTLSIS